VNYFSELCFAMATLAKERRAIFLGQGVANLGTTMSPTFRDVPRDQLLEMPVAEDMQMGIATGMAIDGMLPVCVFPRWNFLLCAANQLVNHLDRLPLYSAGGYRTKVIIRVATPTTKPFYPGPQHDDDFSKAFHKMLRTIKVIQLPEAESIMPAYRRALVDDCSTILVERTELYGDQRADSEHRHPRSA